jgi:hypothetical protein
MKKTGGEVRRLRIKTILAAGAGLVFLLADLRVFGFNILPDIVGMLVIAVTAGILAEHEPSFSRLRTFAFAVSVPELAFMLQLLQGGAWPLLILVARSLVSLLLLVFFFSSLSRLARTWDAGRIIGALDTAFYLCALSRLLPFLSETLPRASAFAAGVVTVAALNAVIQSYRAILLPIPDPPPEETAEDEPGEPTAPDGDLAAEPAPAPAPAAVITAVPPGAVPPPVAAPPAAVPLPAESAEF